MTKKRRRDEAELKRRVSAYAPNPKPAAAITFEFEGDRAVLVEAEIALAEQVDQPVAAGGSIKFKGGLKRFAIITARSLIA